MPEFGAHLRTFSGGPVPVPFSWLAISEEADGRHDFILSGENQIQKS